jgi:DNA recombination protein RmuC
MDPFVAAILLLVGIVGGAVASFIVLRARTDDAVNLARSQSASDAAALNERLQGREQRLAELQATVAKLGGEVERFNAALQAESVRRSAAERSAERIAPLEARVEELQREAAALRGRLTDTEARVEEERKASARELALVNEAKEKLGDAFKALSSEALKSNNQSFLELAKATLEKFQEGARSDLEQRQKSMTELVKPINETLAKVGTQITELEKARVDAYAEIRTQFSALGVTQKELRDETGRLVRALRAPSVRGRWGELQLKRVVEIAGMLDHCDFEEQSSVDTDDGRLRPDMIVRLPGGKNVVVDAKAPLEAYLNALEAPDEETRREFLIGHARQIRDHMAKLGQKSYWDQFQPAPEFVVLFLPGEMFFSAALEQNTQLIEEGIGLRVVPASPTTLIALLRSVAYGWRQERVTENAHRISELGRELYERLCAFGDHMAKVGRGLDGAVRSYNRAVGSLETRVMVTGRRFAELGAVSSPDAMAELEPVEQQPRELDMPARGALPGREALPFDRETGDDERDEKAG